MNIHVFFTWKEETQGEAALTCSSCRPSCIEQKMSEEILLGSAKPRTMTEREALALPKNRRVVLHEVDLALELR